MIQSAALVPHNETDHLNVHDSSYQDMLRTRSA